jgi:hypothetical protein
MIMMLDVQDAKRNAQCTVRNENLECELHRAARLLFSFFNCTFAFNFNFNFELKLQLQLQLQKKTKKLRDLDLELQRSNFNFATSNTNIPSLVRARAR